MWPEEANRVTANSDSPGPSVLQARTMRRIALRIVPFLMVCYFVSFLDRVNVGFAALQMVKDLHMSPAVFGFGSGVFFVSYFLCEVPSNLILQKVGARLWIARIMITWGVLAAGMALVTGPRSFYVMRLLLGAAEAGFFPGVILYLTYWFLAEYRARVVGWFTVAIPVMDVHYGGSARYLAGTGLPCSAERPAIRCEMARHGAARLAIRKAPGGERGNAVGGAN